MKVTVESTEQIVELTVNGRDFQTAQARVWKGKTESGIEVQMLVCRIAADLSADLTEFERELREQPAPQVPLPAFPLRMVL